MKKIIRSSFFLTLIALSVLTGCKKDETDPNTKTVPTNLKQNDNTGSTEVDEAISNVNDVISNQIGGGAANARIAAYDLPCGVVKFDSTVSSGKKTYTLKFGDQNKCGYKKKSGDVSFKLENGSHFNDIDAKFTITFINYTVESNATGQSVTVNGTIAVTNLTGGYIWQVVIPSDNALHKDDVTHSVRGKFMVTHSNGAVRERNYFQKRTWASTSGWAGLRLTLSGDTTAMLGTNTYSNVYETGKTLDGNFDYVSNLSENFLWSNCGATWAGPYVLVKGKARANVNIPNVTPAYFDVQAGYIYNISNTTATPTTDANLCDANAYKITIELGTYLKSEQYQLY
ncbi:hypothetical protein [Sporocytophaga myxococcoides]|uniref:hypothetical protein n=1 Tax=Sporocytophaga myxococcoides TaxID=153721 RepID=UPI000401F0AD|nr:hypothetical protein [Sporocytophaga myxococcoides]